MAKKRYYQIWDFMTEDLDLKKNELLVYALIYSFSRKKNTRFNGSVAYIAARTNASVRDVKYSIASLKKKGLIKVFKKNATRCEYYAVKPDKVDEEVSAKIAPINDNEVSAKIAPFSKKQEGSKIAPPLVQNLHSTGAKIAHNNKKDNKNIYKDRSDCLAEEKPDIPTLEEVRAYVSEHHLKIDPDKYFAKNEYDHWITKAGTPVRCWRKHIWFWSDTERPEKDCQKDKYSFQQNTYDFKQLEKDLIRN